MTDGDDGGGTGKKARARRGAKEVAERINWSQLPEIASAAFLRVLADSQLPRAAPRRLNLRAELPSAFLETNSFQIRGPISNMSAAQLLNPKAESRVCRAPPFGPSVANRSYRDAVKP